MPLSPALLYKKNMTSALQGRTSSTTNNKLSLRIFHRTCIMKLWMPSSAASVHSLHYCFPLLHVFGSWIANMYTISSKACLVFHDIFHGPMFKEVRYYSDACKQCGFDSIVLWIWGNCYTCVRVNYRSVQDISSPVLKWRRWVITSNAFHLHWFNLTICIVTWYWTLTFHFEFGFHWALI